MNYNNISAFMRWFAMKKDCELPWVTRIARWGVVAFGMTYGVMYLCHLFKEWFLV